ncbi:uncharacterized protein LOC133312961 [Gastrolobium bilobum]|uniref:uncharacterized protein LOC133312961 n=1 Tax=Gastrolobium bilobum TaxID=150636 RepID=UPI002AAF25F8|nr:uncharacterized protein LOC133312961 [Gastrolobium bilobum]
MISKSDAASHEQPPSKCRRIERCAFRGHDETINSRNSGNFIEMIKLLASYNENVLDVVLQNAPLTSKYTSPQIQKEILYVLANKVRKQIHKDIGSLSFNICGQGYDGASNMRGEWNKLQELFLKECPCAYYAIGELETGTGSNQVGTLKRASDTRWGSHFYSICSLQRRYNESCSVLEIIRSEGTNYSQRGEATAAYKMITSFEFIFNLFLMKEIMSITEILCQALQQKSQDVLNAIQLVSSTKELIQELRDDGWKKILQSVVNFSKFHEIDVPDFNAQYIEGRGRRQLDQITIEHHYHFDIFNLAIDFQLQELDIRFNEQSMELLSLSSSLDPKDGYKSFNVDDICSVAEKYYPLDFS